MISFNKLNRENTYYKISSFTVTWSHETQSQISSQFLPSQNKTKETQPWTIVLTCNFVFKVENNHTKRICCTELGREARDNTRLSEIIRESFGERCVCRSIGVQSLWGWVTGLLAVNRGSMKD
jgi:hypothetical protein